MITDEQLNYLGEYFVYHKINITYNITFEDYIFLASNDLWNDYKTYKFGNV